MTQGALLGAWPACCLLPRAVSSTMPRAVILVGPPKTGSSHVQAFLANNQAHLRSHGWQWPRSADGHEAVALRASGAAPQLHLGVLEQPLRCGGQGNVGAARGGGVAPMRQRLRQRSRPPLSCSTREPPPVARTTTRPDPADPTRATRRRCRGGASAGRRLRAGPLSPAEPLWWTLVRRGWRWSGRRRRPADAGRCACACACAVSCRVCVSSLPAHLAPTSCPGPMARARRGAMGTASWCPTPTRAASSAGHTHRLGRCRLQFEL